MKKEIRLGMIISLVHHAKLFEWTAEELRKRKVEQTYYLLHHKDTHFENALRSMGLTVHRIHYSGKKDMPGVVFRLRKILKKDRINVVHTHLFDAGVAGMLAARLAGVRKRIHSRHDAMINHDYHPSTVKWDKFTNKLATDIIAVSRSVKGILTELENVPEPKVHVVHHGFHLEEYAQVSDERIVKLKKKYPQLQEAGPVIGVVSRLIHWKGIQHTIAAFRSLLLEYPSAHLVITNANGPYENEIKKLLQEISPANHTVIVYEADMAALYHVFDIFVHVPITARAEAFGQIYVESMAAGIPGVFTLSGIAADYIHDRVNALTVPFNDPGAIFKAMKIYLSDDDLRKRIATTGQSDVRKEFTLDRMIDGFMKIYRS